MAPSIIVDRLSKCYRIQSAATGDGYRTLRESLSQSFGTAWQRLRRAAATGARRDYWALRDVSFEISAGEAVGIVGANGAGKSTLLKILSRITPPTSGTAMLDGRLGSLLEVGTGFHPELSGRENVYLNGSILGMSRRDIARQFDEIVAFSGVEPFIDTPIKRYSSGMLVRLAFAVAAHLDLEIMLIDEVLAVGDLEFQRKCLGKMEDIAGAGRTVLFVSHNMAAITQLCSRAILLEQGQIVADGEVSRVTEQYVARYTRFTHGESLTDWPVHRQGEARFVALISANDIALPAEVAVASGGSIDFLVGGQATDGPLTGLACQVHICTEDGLRIMTLNSQWHPLPRATVSGRAALRCRLAALPLVPGRYLLDVHCTDASGYSELYERVGALHVLPGDACNVGQPTYKKHGYVSAPAEWSLETDAD